jgi:7,8-dihydroneopterin aldolase/epimerase/oxygenase
VSDRILIEGVQCDARVGVSDGERDNEQPLELDLDLSFPPERRTTIGEAADYRRVVAMARDVVRAEKRRLLEHLAEDIAVSLKREFSAISVTVRVRKPRIAEKYRVSAIGVEVTR